MSRKTILFVDDEPLLLNGLRRMLYPLRHQWDIHFADSGAKALELMDELPVAVLVTDMRMPGMNGFRLMQAVQERHPLVIRVMLTGQPDKEVYCEVMTICHYFLWKPVKLEEIQQLLSMISALDASLHDENLMRLIGRITALPSLPPLFNRLMALMDNQDTINSEIAEVVKEDMAMTAQILKLVNSAFFTLTRRIDTIENAIAYLGLDMLRQLILVTHLFTQCSKQVRDTYALDDLWQHCLCTATLAKSIAEVNTGDASAANNAYLAGLLHEIGKLILIAQLPETYSAILKQTAEEGRPQTEVETSTLGTNHAAIGGYLTSLWGLPHTITEAVTLHHTTAASAELSKVSPVLEAVWHANRICRGDATNSLKYLDILVKWQAILTPKCEVA